MARLTFFRSLTSRLSLRHPSSSNTSINTSSNTLTTSTTTDTNLEPPNRSDSSNNITPDSTTSCRHPRDDDLASTDTPATSISRSSSPSLSPTSSLPLAATSSALPSSKRKSPFRSLTGHSRAGSSPPLTSPAASPPSDLSTEPDIADVAQSHRRYTVDFSISDSPKSLQASLESPDAALVSDHRESSKRGSPSRPVSVSFALPADSPESGAPLEPEIPRRMVLRKLWVKRPHASATLVQIKEDDLVDDVRDMVLRKYANSLGRTFDAPDMVLRIVSRADHGGPRPDRVLAPEEEMIQTIDAYYPGGQTVDDALIIDVPQKRSTPRPSPRHAQPHYTTSYYDMDDSRPHESRTDYFPPMPAVIPQGAMPLSSTTLNPHNTREHHLSLAPGEHPKSMSIINTGTIPLIPSPGGVSAAGGPRRHKERGEHRPRPGRNNTSSPTIISHPPPTTASLGMATPIAPIMSQQPQPPSSPLILPHRTSTRMHPDSVPGDPHALNGVPPIAPPLPSPPAPQAEPTNKVGSTPPTPNGTASLAHRRKTPKSSDKRRGPSRQRQQQPMLADPYGTNPALPNISSMLDSSVPPINVLIVEDNHITLRILESLMKRLKVRWQTAMNGQIAVDKWKKGGFHLVLMDIHMPVMNGLLATKEIRRLERVNGIGVFPASNPASPAVAANHSKKRREHSISKEDINNLPADVDDEEQTPPSSSPTHIPDDQLPVAEGLFKSPVILVALTASSLQSDRNEALAAGCNDFLTKPVDFVWLERKVKEWGCMQALIDFDGWRKWKAIAAKEEAGKSDEQKKKDKDLEEKQRIKLEKMAKLQERQRANEAEKKREKERAAAEAAAEEERKSAERKNAPDAAAQSAEQNPPKDSADAQSSPRHPPFSPLPPAAAPGSPAALAV